MAANKKKTIAIDDGTSVDEEPTSQVTEANVDELLGKLDVESCMRSENTKIIDFGSPQDGDMCTLGPLMQQQQQQQQKRSTTAQ